MIRSLSLLSVFLVFPWLAAAQSPVSGQEQGTGASGLPIPRFASLHTNEINMRTGPGTRYPIEWVYVREGLPVEITGEFDIWRRIRDWEGSEGWVHKGALTGKRTLIITGAKASIREDSNETAPVKAFAEPGVIGKLLGCEIDWCQVRFDNINGYLPKTAFWGVYSKETFN
jgi:SH3-like domain-containing protein